jgi:hypothetical protein
MSFAEIKDGVRALTVEQRLDIAALIIHLNRAEDGGWQRELDKRLTAMEAGRKHGQPELERCLNG